MTDVNISEEKSMDNDVNGPAQTGTSNPLSPFEALSGSQKGEETAQEAAMSVPMKIQVVVGRTEMTVRDVMNIRRGAVVELDRKAGDVVDITVNGKVLAKGELTVFEDGRIGVTLVEIVRGIA